MTMSGPHSFTLQDQFLSLTAFESVHKLTAGSARVCFFDQAGYIAALRTKFVHLNTSDVNKQVSCEGHMIIYMYSECMGM